MPESIMIIVMSMLKRRKITLQNSTGQCFTGIVNKIEAEDGSGTSFNIMLSVNPATTAWVYLKRPEGMGTLDNPIKTNRNVETYELTKS